MTPAELAAALRASAGFAHKRDIGQALGALARTLPRGLDDLAQAVPIGDDCAAIPDGDGYLLLAIEGFVSDFVQEQPAFAGWCGVMVNLSDIAAMGGRPIAVVDALWSRGDGDDEAVLGGLAEAAARYGVPIVGGHTNRRSAGTQLAVAVLGRARCLLSGSAAVPGDTLLMAIDLRGAYEGPRPFFNAATPAPAERLRGDLAVLPALAEAGECRAAKDISMAGAVGTALMMLEASGVGARIDVGAIPRPAGVPLLRWLQSFPSYGYVLAVAPAQVAAVRARFAARGIACAAVGEVTAARRVWLHDEAAGATPALLWDLATEAFIAPAPIPGGRAAAVAPLRTADAC
ncbi:sll0787 family AIR synthase-like protein [Piscinibacter sakaiensis]|uniref:Selenophosphate synthetase-related protein MJ0640 n=1 Tax=Piscinibacter sakaiensis TaxID=1547922 RepID=A0A0K8P273_PISS1|nr:sll0787 family AIR synthase-like protein [Piscinibacter sakaiensis]GAP36270.1 selenophosphate synthetase-related protein MJ0640 [Piscinibacter sakaiensis]